MAQPFSFNYPIQVQSSNNNKKEIKKLFIKLLKSKIDFVKNGGNANKFILSRGGMLFASIDHAMNPQSLVVTEATDNHFVVPSYTSPNNLRRWTNVQKRQWLKVLESRKGGKQKELYNQIGETLPEIRGIIVMFKISRFGVIKSKFQISLEQRLSGLDTNPEESKPSGSRSKEE